MLALGQFLLLKSSRQEAPVFLLSEVRQKCLGCVSSCCSPLLSSFDSSWCGGPGVCIVGGGDLGSIIVMLAHPKPPVIDPGCWALLFCFFFSVAGYVRFSDCNLGCNPCFLF
jgi:hypothetical protein